MNILVVDDVLLTRKMLERTLEKDGHQVTTLGTSIEAYDIITSDTIFDVVICDLIMPDMDGTELFKKYKEFTDTMDVAKVLPFILITASQDVVKLRKSYGLGFVDIMVKPIDFKRLKSTLVRLESEQFDESDKMLDSFHKTAKLIKKFIYSREVDDGVQLHDSFVESILLLKNFFKEQK